MHIWFKFNGEWHRLDADSYIARDGAARIFEAQGYPVSFAVERPTY